MAGYCPALELVSQKIGDAHICKRRGHRPWGSRPHSMVRLPLSSWRDYFDSPRPPAAEEFRTWASMCFLSHSGTSRFWKKPSIPWKLLEDMRYPVSEAWKAWETVRKGRDVPSVKQLPEMFELLHKDVFRQTYNCLSPVSSDEIHQPSTRRDGPMPFV